MARDKMQSEPLEQLQKRKERVVFPSGDPSTLHKASAATQDPRSALEYHYLAELKSIIWAEVKPSYSQVNGVPYFYVSPEHQPQPSEYFQVIVRQAANTAMVQTHTSERSWYKPLADFLNTVLPELQKFYPNSILSGLRFDVYGRDMGESGDGLRPLKPDLVGHLAGPLRDNQTLLWNQVIIPVEVKNKEADMRNQLLTYLRAIITAQPRLFVVGFMVHVKRRTFTAVTCDRSNIWEESTASFMDEKGRLRILNILTGIMSRDKLETAGFDPMFNGKHISVPKFGLAEIVDTLYLRDGMLGRATEVYTVKLTQPRLSPGDGPQLIQLQPSGVPTFADLPNDLPSLSEVPKVSSGKPTLESRLGCLLRPRRIMKARPIAYPSSIASKPVKKTSAVRQLGSIGPAADSDLSHAPEKSSPLKCFQLDTPLKERHVLVPNLQLPPLRLDLIGVKLWWQSHGYNKERLAVEADMYTAVNAIVEPGDDGTIEPTNVPFGLPIILYSGLACTAEVTQLTTATLDVGVASDETRTRCCTAFATIGSPLYDCSGPRQLFIAITHAIIGHFNLFLARRLHRDVSYGNVLLIGALKPRKPCILGHATLQLAEKAIASRDEALRKNPSTFYFSWRARMQNGATLETATAKRNVWEKLAHMDECCGVIIDGDHSVIMDQERTRVARSGTTPFMSIRLLSSFGTTKLHTALDDLESFAWVGIWVILQRCLDMNIGMTSAERSWLSSLNGESPIVVSYVKTAISLAFQTHHLSPALVKFCRVLGPWFEVSEVAQRELDLMSDARTDDDILLLCLRAYYEFLEFMDTEHPFDFLPETWEELRQN